MCMGSASGNKPERDQISFSALIAFTNEIRVFNFPTGFARAVFYIHENQSLNFNILARI